MDSTPFSTLQASNLAECSLSNEEKRVIDTDFIQLFYGHHCIDDAQLTQCLTLLQNCDFITKRTALFDGNVVNMSEQRAAHHTRLRTSNPDSLVSSCLERMRTLAEAIHTGTWPATITDVINIGIGGSDLGPALVYDALHTPEITPQCHFISNIDSRDTIALLNRLNPKTTLCIIVSKTFTTSETLANAKRVKAWLESACDNLSPHLLAVTSNKTAATNFGINEQNIFPMWEWVGGRFSLWSAVGLCLAVSLGFDTFQDLLKGASNMDEHFHQAPLEENMPVIMALLSFWYHNIHHAQTQAVLSYAQPLRLLPNYLQQLWMESLGKHVTQSGQHVDYPTGPIIWGGTGTNTQHSFHQLLMQGTHLIPVDFILPKQRDDIPKADALALERNAYAQMKALWEGQTTGHSYQHIPAKHPYSLITLNKLDAKSLGALLACYEHTVFTLSVLLDINAFDQWGVELGKVLYKKSLKP